MWKASLFRCVGLALVGFAVFTVDKPAVSQTTIGDGVFYVGTPGLVPVVTPTRTATPTQTRTATPTEIKLTNTPTATPQIEFTVISDPGTTIVNDEPYEGGILWNKEQYMGDCGTEYSYVFLAPGESSDWVVGKSLNFGSVLTGTESISGMRIYLTDYHDFFGYGPPGNVELTWRVSLAGTPLSPDMVSNPPISTVDQSYDVGAPATFTATDAIDPGFAWEYRIVNTTPYDIDFEIRCVQLELIYTP